MADVFSSLPIEVPVAAGKVIVVGGSVAGLFAAALLQRAGWQIALYERSVLGLGGKGAGLVAQPDVRRILNENWPGGCVAFGCSRSRTNLPRSTREHYSYAATHGDGRIESGRR